MSLIRYITMCKRKMPVITPELSESLVRELAGANKTVKILDAMERYPIIVVRMFALSTML
ncbi:conserved hypothetical protein [Culex quinquefasciatus]|uniref:Uncharacterized protein n=1 Tax=Culex quinquefasciatus TaxID=7176 RepID=B0WAW0_CULQU|nr:conserved hypothetical protein [Culex quinquefasciatus]|eukprot:XP_001845844.1 conserved hypothetical protein [Culex quinquefasciatus]